MEYTASMAIDRAYFEEWFDQWLTHLSRFRKWQIKLSTLLVAVAVVLLVIGHYKYSAGVALFAAIEFIEFHMYRRIWVNRRIQSRSSDKHNRVDIRISEAGMYQKGPTSEGTNSWDAVKAAFPTAKGLFLAIGDGMSIYVPDSSMSDRHLKEFVMTMVKEKSE